MKKRKPAVRPWFEHLIGYLGLGGWRRRNGRVTRTVARRLGSAKGGILPKEVIPGRFCQTKRRR